MTEEQLNQIIEGGVYIDKNFQDPKFSYMHSMRNGETNQSITEAISARNEWVNDNITIFKTSKSNNYKELGYAIHAMSDQYAPTHSWKSWSGLKLSNGFGLFHLCGELNLLGINNSSFNLSVSLVKNVYKKAIFPDPTPGQNPLSPINPIPSQPIPNPDPTPALIIPPTPTPTPQPPVPLPPKR